MHCTSLLFATLALAALALPLSAQTLLLGNHSIDGNLCVGNDCTGSEVVAPHALKLKALQTSLLFEDTSLGTGGFATRDWALVANTDPLDLFTLRDMDTGRNVLTVAGNAPAHGIYMAADGKLGLGTGLPQAALHIVSVEAPAIRLEHAGSPQVWAIAGEASGLSLRDILTSATPLRIEAGAPDHALRVASDGDIGLGTQTPEGKLHVKGDGVQLSYLESGNGGAVQLRFRTNSENRRFLAVNNANEVKSQIVFGDNQIQFLGQTVAQEWLRISSAGIVSSGPTCNPNPCDATFDPEAFTVPPIAERAAYMWGNRHLPAMGPTEPGQPFNLTEKTAAMLHELEIAHIYIAQQHEEISSLKAEMQKRDEATQAQIEGQMALINTLSRRLSYLESRNP